MSLLNYFRAPLSPEVQGELRLLDAVVRDDAQVAKMAEGKVAAGRAAIAHCLKLSTAPVHSHSHAEAAMDTSKMAAAAQALTQLNDLVGELRSACTESMKVAAALAGAVKLAQDGLIDNADVFSVARESLVEGTAKTSTVSPIGDLIGPADSAPGAEMDPLTATLRSLRQGGL